MGQTITIITATYNAAADLARTAASIRAQTYTDIQWIVIDGGSRDGTKDEMEKNRDIIAYSVSEPDRGIYDAWNKGCSQIIGEWVMFIGAGDELEGPDTLERCAQHLRTAAGKHDIVYGRLHLVSRAGHVIAEFGEPWEKMKGRWGGLLPLLPPHPSSFHHRLLFRGSHSFDARYRYAGDTAFVVQSVLNRDPLYIPVVVDRMLAGGVSVDPANILKVARERRMIAKSLRIRARLLHMVAWNAGIAAQLALYALPPSIRRGLRKIVSFSWSPQS